jgi:hypothetical protein
MVHHVEAALTAVSASVSLNQTIGDDRDGELADLLPDHEAADPFEEAERSLRHQQIRSALDALPNRERRILEPRFGFEGEPWTLDAIGHELDLTRERIRQLETQALSRLASLHELAGLTTLDVVHTPSSLGRRPPSDPQTTPARAPSPANALAPPKPRGCAPQAGSSSAA